VHIPPSNGPGVATRASHTGTANALVYSPQTWEQEYGQSLGLVFTQYPMNKGLKIFVDKVFRQPGMRWNKSTLWTLLNPSTLEI
jgi:hypothetical protein